MIRRQILLIAAIAALGLGLNYNASAQSGQPAETSTSSVTTVTARRVVVVPHLHGEPLGRARRLGTAPVALASSRTFRLLRPHCAGAAAQPNEATARGLFRQKIG